MLDLACVYVDLETTGGNATRDRITEIAIIEVKDGVVIDQWSSLVNPQQPIHLPIQLLTGISNEMVSQAPCFTDLQEPLYRRLKGRLFIAHNARFDYGFLKNEFRRGGIDFQASADPIEGNPQARDRQRRSGGTIGHEPVNFEIHRIRCCKVDNRLNARGGEV